MVPKINIKYFENEKYAIKQTYNKISQINFLDFQHVLPTTSSYYSSTIGINSYTKTINLRTLEIPFNQFALQNNDLLYQQQLLFNIKNSLDNEFCKKITVLGEKHKKLDLKFDINISEQLRINKDANIGRYIFNKLNSTSNYIATQGRISSANYLLSNKKTYNYILSYLSSSDINLIYENNKLKISNMTYIIDDNIDDDIIICGRKNDISQPGVHCLILTDNNNNIYFDQIQDFQSYPETKLIMYYDIFEIGNNPEYQYFQINTRTLSYYRKMKLDKIKLSIKNN